MNTEVLWDAAAELGEANRKIRKRIGSAVPSIPEYEKTLALGVAADWLRWAAGLKQIKFRLTKKQSPERLDGMEELTRFYYAWTAANALFGRTAIVKALDPVITADASELTKFRVLHKRAGLPAAVEADHVAKLRKLLFSHLKVTMFPWNPGIESTTIINVVYQKYTDPSQHKRANYKTVKAAIDADQPGLIDLSLIIYLTRNWTLHGSLLNSGFRGPKEKFELYIDTVNQALADILLGAAKEIRAVI